MISIKSAVYLLAVVAVIRSAYGGSPFHHHHMVNDRRTTVVLHEWRFDDIADECEQFLGPYGYGAVQVSPVTEPSIMMRDDHVKRPWWERYQPVSYKIVSRSGNEADFSSMVDRCNRAGVRIYVDVILNHMTGNIGEGRGLAGSYYNTERQNYDGVPYGPGDFNSHEKCQRSKSDEYQRERNCDLLGLNDLDQGKQYVREKITEFLNNLIRLGAAGFRVDASKHMWPTDLSVIFHSLDNLNTTYFSPNSRPFVSHEVFYLGGEGVQSSHYVHLGRVFEFKYGHKLREAVRKNNGQYLKNLRHFGHSWGMLHDDDAIALIDNHDLQRGHLDDLRSALTYRDSRLHKMATAFMLAWPYGLTAVMSSYYWPTYIHGSKDFNDWMGPPHDSSYVINRVTRNADMSCGNGWICEHRWRQIYNMVKFRNAVGNSRVESWWDNGFHQIAFGRGDTGFIAINNENFPLRQRLRTGLPSGRYCDIITGNLIDGKCTGTEVNVDGQGYADVYVDNATDDPVLAIYTGSRRFE